MSHPRAPKYANLALYEHAEVAEDRKRMAAECMRVERVGEARHHTRVEDTETRLLLPGNLTGWSQQVLDSKNPHYECS